MFVRVGVGVNEVTLFFIFHDNPDTANGHVRAEEGTCVVLCC